jgi:putative ABC transport system permease protein
MMAALRFGNRAMFWRIVRRLLGANRGRLFVILVALGAGAAVTAALLNLQVDAKRRLTTEFNAFGPNVIIAPRVDPESPAQPVFLTDSVLKEIEGAKVASPLAYAAFLYGIVDVTPTGEANGQTPKGERAILAGYFHEPPGPSILIPAAISEAEEKAQLTNSRRCGVGQKLAEKLHLHSEDGISLVSGKRKDSCGALILAATGGPEDTQVFLEMPAVRVLLEQPGHISLIQLRASGTPEEIQSQIAVLQKRLPYSDVHPIRQFTEGEAKIYERISGLLTATVVIVLFLTGLCVMAAMTNVAMERRNDVGLMKAIGGATRRVLRLFLAEAALLGLAGGVIGAAAGIFLSIWLGKQVFGVAAQPQLIVYPVAVALTMIVAILSAYPLRRLASVRPASVFRGEA